LHEKLKLIDSSKITETQMKRVLILPVVALMIVSCSSGEKYTVKGKVKGSGGVTFYLKINRDGSFVNIDSAVSAKSGSFKMKGGAVEYPQTAVLAAGNTNKVTSFYIENSNITVSGNIDSLFKADIKGSKTHDEYRLYIERNKPLSDAYQVLSASFMTVARTNDTDRIAEMRAQFDSIEKEVIKNQKEFIDSHPASFVTPSLLTGLSGSMNAGELELHINKLDTSISKLPAVKELQNMVAAMRSVEAGKKAPDFTANGVDSIPVSLYSKVGANVLLVNFWAAWHTQSRRENPGIARAYSEFHKKGFDIVSVSLDSKRGDWIKAIEDDKLEWTHVSDLNGWNSPVAALYAVNTIPASFLIDKNGMIIAANLTGDELYGKVKEILEAK
jgi:peroxiredoxin